jgi:hypothetical protein
MSALVEVNIATRVAKNGAVATHRWNERIAGATLMPAASSIKNARVIDEDASAVGDATGRIFGILRNA